MTDDGVSITRRRLLGGIAGAGTFGVTAGAFTAASFEDRELLPIGMTAGEAGIDVTCDAPDCGVEDGALQFAVGDLVPGEEGSRTFTVSVVDNPVRVWLRTGCPPEIDAPYKEDPKKGPGWKWPPESGKHGGKPAANSKDRDSKGRTSKDRGRGKKWGGGPPGDGPPKHPIWPVQHLASALEVRLSVVEGCRGDGTRLFPTAGEGSWGTLREFQAAFANGARLDAEGSCFEASSDVCLEFEYRLPAWSWVDPEGETGLELELYAEQCRHVSESDVGNPFEARDCGTEPDPEPDPEPEPDPCDGCTELGKLEVEGDRLKAGTYEFDELEDPFASDGHQYEIDVLDVSDKDDGAETTCVEFRLLRDGEERRRMCQVDVKGGRQEKREGGSHRGNDGGDAGGEKRKGGKASGVPHEIEPPATHTPGKLCTEKFDDDHHGKRGGGDNRPAISNLVVHVCDTASKGGDGE